MGVLDPEVLFQKSLSGPRKQARAIKDVNLVIGVPFYNEVRTLPRVLQFIEEGLAGMQALERSLIICAGDPAGAEVLKAIRNLDFKAAHMEFLMLPGCNGRGASIRAIMELANLLESDLVLLAADLVGGKGTGLQPEHVKHLIEPIREEYDLVLASFRRQYYEDLLSRLFLGPLLEVFYGFKISDPISGNYAVSHDLVEDFCTDLKFWSDLTRGFGIDPWMITRAIVQRKKICEVPLGFKTEEASLDKMKHVFKDLAGFIFEAIKRDEEFWRKGRLIRKTPDICEKEPFWETPLLPSPESRALIRHFANGFLQYRAVFADACPEALFAALERSASAQDRDFYFDGEVWANLVYDIIFHYSFAPDADREDILEALTAAFCGRLAGFLSHLEVLQEDLASSKNAYSATIIAGRAESEKEEQRKHFLHGRDSFIHRWSQKTWEHKPPLIPADFLEFIPGRPIVLPKSIEGQGGREIRTADIFSRLQNRYTERFHEFLEKGLKIPSTSPSPVIARHLEEFMAEMERVVDRLAPGNIYTEEGTREAVASIFELLGYPKTYGIKEEIFREALMHFPPLNIMIPEGCRTPRELTERMLPRDAVTLANFIETRRWTDRVLLRILDHLTPEDMEEVEIKPIVLGESILGGAFKLGKISDLNMLTTRLVVSPLSKGVGGRYPKLRFFLFIGRQIMIAQNYSLLYRTYARERKNLGKKIGNSLIGRFETSPFSAYNIFENFHHRALVTALRILAQKITLTGLERDAWLLREMCNGYGISQVLDDGTFIPCSSWSWASYSAKGGRGIPTPLSSHVEEKWFNHDFLEEIYAELGFDPGEILQRLTQLIGEGRAYDDLLDVLLGLKPKDVTVIAQETQDYPPAKPLVRHPGNPILSPLKEHPWESRYVLNAAAVRLQGKVYLLYRAYGDDEVSRIGLAVTDGYRVLERLPEPVFVPQTDREKKGVEDPRVVIINGRLYMLYTAYDGVIAQIAAASISVEDFLARRFDRWRREGLAFQDVWDKDAFLFPERIGGRYVIYHRIEPSIWVSYLDQLKFPVPKESHTIIMGPRPGKMWDFLKIGAGAQPIKTRYGWLLIYHGVDKTRVYRLGVMLVPLDSPERIIYRSPNPILSPETEYEIGKPGESWVPNVVFTCGAVPAEDKEILDADDEILVYYGAADTHLCLATGRVGDLIPEEIRRELENQARP